MVSISQTVSRATGRGKRPATKPVGWFWLRLRQMVDEYKVDTVSTSIIPSVLRVWIDTSTLFAANSPVMLVCSLSLAVLSLISTMAGTLIAWGWPILVALQLFIQGAISLVTLQGGQLSTRGILTTVWRRWTALLVSVLVYVGMLGLARVTAEPLLRQLRVGETGAGATEPALSRWMNVAELNGLIREAVLAVIHDPGMVLPISAGETTSQAQLPRVCTDASFLHGQVSEERIAEYVATHCSPNPAHGTELAIAAVTGLVWLSMNTLLHFRVVATFGSPRPGLLASLITGTYISWRSFGTVTLQVWTVRLGFIGLRMLFAALPALVAQRDVLPLMRQFSHEPVLQMIGSLGIPAACAMFDGLLATFGVVYDAKLWLVLRGGHEAGR